MIEKKSFVTMFLGAMFNFLGALAIPVLLLVGCNVIDYATGLMAAPSRGQDIKSGVGIRGIFKKVGMWLVVLVGYWMDILVSYSLETLGIDFGWNHLIAVIAAVWLVINEMISILENLIDIGVELPPFVMPIAKKIRSTIETSADVEAEDCTDEKRD